MYKRQAQGKENVRQYLIDNPDVAAELKEQILKEFRLGEGSSVSENSSANEINDVE